jgi:arylsulfatase A-like enzyme
MQSRISTSGFLALAALVALAGCSDKGKAQPNTQDPAAAGNAAPGPGEPAKPKAPAKAPSRGPERPVYSLVDNRLSAHLVNGSSLLIPAGSSGFAKYTRFGNTRKNSKRPWQLRQVQGDVPVGRMTGASGKLDVPLTAAQAEGEGVVRIRAYSEKDRAFGVRINGNPDLNAQLTTGWSTIEVTAPAGQLKAGENEILLFARGAGLDVAWVQVGAKATAAPVDGATAFYDSAGKALVLPEGSGLAWYVTVPEAGRVAGDLADGTCEVAVTATAEDGQAATGALTGLGSAVDLAALAGKAARVELIARGCPKAQLANAALVVPGTAPEAVKGAPPSHIVLFIMDSLRADRVRPWNPSARPETPVFDKLAETSAVFLQNYVQGNESRVSHASIWSSLYPIKHAMIPSDAKLALKWTTIDEVAKSAGMYTAGVSANGYVAPTRWGFGQKWDSFANHIHDHKGLKGEDIVEAGLRAIEGKKEPWFLYLGTIDTHVSWRGKEPWLSQYDPGYSGRFAEVFSGEDAGRAAGGMKMTDKEIAHVRAIYDSNVSYQDKLLGDLIAKLEEQGIWDKTMLIVTADHGDEQWEDGKVGHGQSMRDMLVHVPLLVHYPALVPAGKISEGAEVIDIVPTIADALGAPLDPEWQGEPLTRIAQGAGRGYPRLSMTSMYEDAHAGRMGRWKVRVPGSGTPRVFELGSDPDEMKDVAGTAPAAIGGRMVLDALWLLRTFNPEWRKSQWGNAANVSARFAADLGE